MPSSYSLAFDASAMEGHRALMSGGAVAVEVSSGDDGLLDFSVVAPDRAGLLSLVAGVLTVSGVDIREASAFTRSDGVVLELFRGVDRFGRFEDGGGVSDVRDLLRDALGGGVDLDALVTEHVARYRRTDDDAAPAQIVIDLEASDFATVVEVRVDDRIGMLYELTAALTDLGLDVTVAKVATLGEEVVDTFYVVDPEVGKFTDPRTLERVHVALEHCTAGEAYAHRP